MDLRSQILDLGPDPGFGTECPRFGVRKFHIISINLDLDLQILDSGPNPGSGPKVFEVLSNSYDSDVKSTISRSTIIHMVWCGVVWY